MIHRNQSLARVLPRERISRESTDRKL